MMLKYEIIIAGLKTAPERVWEPFRDGFYVKF